MKREVAFLVTFTLFLFGVFSVSAETQSVASVPTGKATPTPSHPKPPSPPKIPVGPDWMPAQKEEYRKSLESYRIDLEQFRQASPLSNMKDYKEGLGIYKNSIVELQK